MSRNNISEHTHDEAYLFGPLLLLLSHCLRECESVLVLVDRGSWLGRAGMVRRIAG